MRRYFKKVMYYIIAENENDFTSTLELGKKFEFYDVKGIFLCYPKQFVYGVYDNLNICI